MDFGMRLLGAIAIFVAFYLFGAFAFWEMSPGLWEQADRALLGILAFVSAVAVVTFPFGKGGH